MDFRTSRLLVRKLRAVLLKSHRVQSGSEGESARAPAPDDRLHIIDDWIAFCSHRFVAAIAARSKCTSGAHQPLHPLAR